METQDVEIQMVTHGDVAEAAKQYATDKVTQITRLTNRPILFVQVKLTLAANRRVERPAVAEATLDLNGQPVRAHVAAHDMMAAIDLLDDRLRRRLDSHNQRLNRAAHRGAEATSPGEWRHGDFRTQRPEYYDRPVDEREVVRHKTFALDPMTAEEAAFDLEVLGHDFYLFTELDSGVDSVVYFAAEDNHLELMQVGDEVELPKNSAVPMRASTVVPVQLTVAEAEERLDTGLETFVFFVNTESGRGNVLYRRYDGHYGLITPA